MTFGVWLFWQDRRDDEVGKLARWLFQERLGVPNIRSVKGAKRWMNNMPGRLPTPEQKGAAETAMKEYLWARGYAKDNEIHPRRKE